MVPKPKHDTHRLLWPFLLAIVLLVQPARLEAQDKTIFLPFVGQSSQADNTEAIVFVDSELRPDREEIPAVPIPWTVKELPVQNQHSLQADIQLSALAVDSLIQQERGKPHKQKLLQTGIVRPLPQIIAAANVDKSKIGQWHQTQQGGRFWTLTIRSPGAKALRLHLDNLRLPAGTQVIIFNPANPREAYGPYRQSDLYGDTQLWTASVFADTVTVELYISPEVDMTNEIGFAIKELAHIYKDLATLLNPQAALQSQEGACHNDVTCTASYSTTAKGVALINMVMSGGIFVCTGSLINDLDSGTWVNYFLTANHCLVDNEVNDSSADLGTQAIANTLEFFWLYQTSTCNGTVPNLANVPRTTGGAELLSRIPHNSGNDHAFLRIRNPVTASIPYLGWTTAALSASVPITSVHHPTGAYKRISFGKVDSSNLNNWLVKWHSGVTEGGSSGSPLFNEQRRIVGQLYGGDSSCDNPSGIDQYGRFNATYTQIKRWLEIGGTINVNSAYTGVELGTPTQPFRGATTAHNFAWDGTRIRFKAGSYPGAITFNKKVTLIADGGVVTIGN